MSDAPILVTGSASGIGAALATMLINSGLPVIGLDRRAEGPAGVDARACDLSDADAVDQAITALPSALSGVASVAARSRRRPA